MAVQTVCDVCGGDLYKEDQHAVAKFPKAIWHSWGFDGMNPYISKRKLDICFDCWHKFKKFVQKGQK